MLECSSKKLKGCFPSPVVVLGFCPPQCPACLGTCWVRGLPVGTNEPFLCSFSQPYFYSLLRNSNVNSLIYVHCFCICKNLSSFEEERVRLISRHSIPSLVPGLSGRSRFREARTPVISRPSLRPAPCVCAAAGCGVRFPGRPGRRGPRARAEGQRSAFRGREKLG